MNIALLVHDLRDYGGHSRYAKKIAERLSKEHNVAIFANRYDNSLDARISYFHVPAARLNNLSCVFTFPIGLGLLERHLKNFDIRHSQGFCGDNNVITAHICVEAYLASLVRLNLKNKISLAMIAAAEKLFYKKSSSPIIAVSEKLAQDLKDLYKLKNPIHIVRHGVDIEKFCAEKRLNIRRWARLEFNIQESETAALYIGDLTKAHHHLKLLSEMCDDIRFLIVTGTKPYRWRARNVTFLNPAENVEKFYSAADAFIFPSVYDAFGMVVLEAMACGLPVFCSNRAGVGEIIDHELDGFVTPLEKWTQVAYEGLHNLKSLSHIGKNAEKKAQCFSWAKTTEETEKIYKSVAK